MKNFKGTILAALMMAASMPAMAYYSAVEYAAHHSALTLTGAWNKPTQNGDFFIPVALGAPPAPPALHIGQLFYHDEYSLDVGFELSYRVPFSNAWAVLNWEDNCFNQLEDVTQALQIPGGLFLPNGAAFPALLLPAAIPAGPITPGINTAFSGVLDLRDRVLNVGMRYLSNCCSEYYSLTWGAYVQWAKLDLQKQLSFVDPAAPNDTQYLTSTQQAEGGGPYLDVTARGYPWGNKGRCYSFFGHAGIAFLQMDNHYRYVRQLNNVTQFQLEPGDSSSLVSKVVADVGLAFHRTFKGPNYWRLGLEFALNYTNYINVLKNGNGPSDVSYDYGRWAPTLKVTVGGVDS